MSTTRLVALASLVLVGLLAAAAPVAAADHPALEASTVRSFLGTLDSVKALGEKYDAMDDPLPDVAGGGAPGPENAARMRGGLLTGALPELREHSAWGEFEALAQEGGFDSVAEWANTGDRIMAGFIQLQVEREAPGAREQMQKAREQIMGNDQMPAAQKEQILAQIDMQMEMFDAMKASEVLQEGDLEVIEPMLDEIQAQLSGS